METALSLAAAVTVASALAVVRARRSMIARVALIIHGLSLVLLLAVLSMPLLALMVAVLGVGTALVHLLTAHGGDNFEAALVGDPFGVWSLVRDVGLLCLLLLLWWWLRRPTLIKGLVETGVSARATGMDVLALLHTRYAGALLGVGLMLLATAIGASRRERDR
jgi:NADH:ubiquinone oxidoreductase subunit 6 (subunit J)